MAAQGKSVLVADDNAAFVELVRVALQSDDIEVLAARDGEEALRLARERRPDVVVLDLLMPRVDGLSALVRLRADAATRDVPVLMVSGMPGGEAERLARAFGAGEFLVKPFPPRVLVERVRALLALNAASPEPAPGAA